MNDNVKSAPTEAAAESDCLAWARRSIAGTIRAGEGSGDERYRVRWTAQPELDTNRSTVKVVYEVECEDLSGVERVRFSEEHLMRYLFPTEVESLAESCGMQLKATGEFHTGRPPSTSIWGVAYLLQRLGDCP